MKFEDVRWRGFSKRVKLSEAIKACLVNMVRFPAEEVKLKDTSITSRILRENVLSKRSIPPFDRSAMDGYAVRTDDIVGASESNPLILNVTGEVKIGKVPTIRVEKGSAVKITTGAVIPDGADAVLKVEDTATLTRGGEVIEVLASIHPGKNIALAGEDIEEGKLVLKAGKRLQPVDRGFLLSAGVTEVKVSVIPSVAIFSTGNELVEAWETELVPGRIPDVNSINLYELCRKEGWNSRIIAILPDDEISLKEAMLKAASEYDVILLSGGTSVGEKDLIPALFNELGTLVFHGIAMRPGGPMSAAVIQDKAFFGLPGFPTATLVTFHFIVHPVIQSLLGMKNASSILTVPVKITRNVGSKLGRLDFLRVKLEKSNSGEILAIPIQIGGSGIMNSMVKSNGIVAISESSEGLKEGDIVEAFLVGVEGISSGLIKEKGSR
ncbi:MAG: molybdopterin molybdotransferase MoeA [Candidatus Hodarchaeales archaeon]|jgi:molybdenum cofactor synthesis domain-containing protein